MTTLGRGEKEDLFLPAQQVLTVVATAGTARVTRLGDKAGQSSQGYSDVASGATKTIGPFANGTRHQVECLSGSIDWTKEEADFPSVAGNVEHIVKLTQAEYDALSPPDDNTLYLIVG